MPEHDDRRHHDDERRVWPLPLGEAPALDVRTDLGSVALVPVAPGEQPRLEAIGPGAARLEVHVERRGDSVWVDVEPLRQFTWWGNWDNRLLLHVPASVSASVATGAGGIDARALDGATLDLRTSAGRITLSRVRGRLRLSADAGAITGRDIAGALDVETQAGSIRLEVAYLDPGEHRVRASMGSIRVELAQGLDVRVESRATMGSARTSYPAHPHAPAVLSLTTEMGSIRVAEGAVAPRPAASPAPGAPPPATPAPANSAPRPAPEAAPTSQPDDGALERILAMVAAGRLSARDADELLRALGRV